MVQTNTKTPVDRSAISLPISQRSALKQFQRAADSEATPLEVVCTAFKPVVKGSLRGFATLTLPAVSLQLIDCGYFQSDEKCWVSFPSRSFEKNGEKVWTKLVDSVDKDSYFRFQRAATGAIENFLKPSSRVDEAPAF